MSREQWGHGYWQGVSDAQNDLVEEPIDIKSLSEFIVCQMCLIKHKRKDPDSLFLVNDAIVIFCGFAGLSKTTMRRIYKYILTNTPLNCGISGDNSGDEWTEDTFILPLWDRTLTEWENLAADIYESAHKEGNNA